jgi:hypothetical protein
MVFLNALKNNTESSKSMGKLFISGNRPGFNGSHIKMIQYFLPGI